MYGIFLRIQDYYIRLKAMADFWARAKKINNIQTVNSDPLLSEFKHHFTILKVYLPRKMNLQSFAQQVPLGFGLPNNSFSNAVYIAQFVNVYDNDLVDIAIGFRRDETAIQIAAGKLEFKYDNRTHKVQLSNGFKIFVQDIRNQQSQFRKKDDSLISLNQGRVSHHSTFRQNQNQVKVNMQKRQSKGSSIKKNHSKRSESRSRSRSRSRQKKKQIFNRISSGAQLYLSKSANERFQIEKRK